MSKYLVSVIDGARARFLTLEPIDNLLDESNCHLVEHKGLLNSAKELQGKELWATTKTGRNHQGTGTQAHAYDDGRESHLHEYGRRFARAIADEIIELTQRYSIRKLVLVAESQTLGVLRESVIHLLPNSLNIQVLAKDLCKLKPLEIHEYLAAKNLLPAHRSVS